MRRAGTSAVVVALSCGVTASATLAVPTSPLPAQLVGTWTRTVTAADVKRDQSYGGPGGGRWTLTIKANGAASVGSKGLGTFKGPIVAAGPNRVHINVGLVFPNTYSWRVSGRNLTFTKISESRVATDKLVVFWGTWKRK